ncbi:MAG: EAL domain-containing protein [Burkholderiales bacterium]|nr:EAL domain-containing protein [Burkholderiales bacterium]
MSAAGHAIELMHRLLKRQIERLGLTRESPPDLERWARLVDRVSAAYTQSDEARQLAERSMEISSRELRALYDREQRANEELEERVRARTAALAQAEAAARESEARFRSLTELSSDWYWQQDASFRYLEITSEAVPGAGAAALVHTGERPWDRPAPNMTEADWDLHRAALEARRSFHELELCRIADDGAERWMSVSGEPIFDAAGAFTGYRGVGKDITARKHAEKLLELEHRVTRELSEAGTAAAGLRAVLRVVCESQGWECGRYLRVDETGGALRCVDAWARDDPMAARFIACKRDAVHARGDGLAGRAWLTGQPVWVIGGAGSGCGAGSALARETGLTGAFLFPVLAEGRIIGILAFNGRRLREPDERLLQAARVVGSQTGQFFQRKEADERARYQARQQRLIAEFGQQVLAGVELAPMLERAAELVAATLAVELACVLELDPGEPRLLYRATVGWPREWIGTRTVPLDPGKRLARVIDTREPLVIDDYGAASPFCASRLTAHGVKSGAIVPVLGPAGVSGVLGVHSRSPRRFTGDDVSFLRGIAGILAIATERKKAEDRLARLAQFDPVTGLPNRHLLRDRLGQSLNHARRNGWLAGLLFVDLDRFKTVNDTFGHGMGDRLLAEAAARLKNCVRNGDTVARLSGDEFAIVLASLAKSEDAALVAQKVVAALAAPFDLAGNETYVSASVGIAVCPADGEEPEALLRNADTAMYRAKEQGRNCYRFYLPQMNERLMERMQLEARLRGALDRGEFLLHYQPKVRLDTGEVSGFEALLRWQQEGKLVAPLEFIPILEETGLIVPVGEWVLRSVCRQIRQWEGEGIAPPPVAVNLSARQFQSRDLAATIRRILEESGVAPDLIELELTETLVMSDAEESIEMLRELKRLGVRLSVDDFGTGYSSLAYLRRFPLDTLKIDRTFIRDIVTSPDDATLALTIINLAHGMRLRVVAEGVETREQADFLRRHGCDEMQGYYFARPLDVAACTRALHEGMRLAGAGGAPADARPALIIVDENERDLASLEQALGAGGFNVLTATSPAAGFALLARHDAAMVVSGSDMPEMSGLAFLANVRKLYPGAVRALLARSDPPLAGAPDAAGIHAFLSKNWDSERLRAEVRQACLRRFRSAPAPGAAPIPETRAASAANSRALIAAAGRSTG